MVAVFTVLVVLTMSLAIVRVATVALMLTGMSRQVARFQARSAFTTTGFTSKEAEQIMTHPVRRRIVLLLMLWGNVGLVTAVASLMLSFLRTDGVGWTGQIWFRVTLLLLGVAALWWIASSRWVDQWTSRIIAWALRTWTDLDARDYASLLHVAGDYAVTEFAVQAGNWLADETLADLRLAREGVLVLGIERANGSYLGAPRGDTVVRPGDVLILYGRQNTFADLNRRRSGIEGDRAHEKAVAEEEAVIQQERDESPAEA